MSTLDPKTAKEVKTAATTQTIRYPLASEGLTRLLDGGITAGRISLFYGPSSSGKSALLMESIGMWQKMGLVCAYVDAEGTYTKEWGARLGIDNDRLILIQSKSSGRIEKKIKPFIEKGIDVVVIDSISDIMPETFVNEKGELNDQDARKQVGAHAKAITALINGMLYVNEKTAICMISQQTTKFSQSYVELIPHGGEKSIFASSVIVRLISTSTEKAQIMGTVQVGDRLIESPIGREVEGYIRKNKTGIQSTKCKWNFYYAGPTVGIDRVGEVVEDALTLGVLEAAGAWIKWPSQDKTFQGKPKTAAALKEDDDLLQKLRAELHMIRTGEVLD